MENIRTMKLEEIRETLAELKARIAEVEAQLAELQSVTEACREDGAESLAEESQVGGSLVGESLAEESQVGESLVGESLAEESQVGESLAEESPVEESLETIQQDLPGENDEEISGESLEGMRMEPQEDIPEDIADAITEDIAEAVPIDISIDDLDIEPVRFEPEPVVVENAKPIEAKSLEEAILESDLEQEKEKKNEKENEPATLQGLRTEGIKETAEVVTRIENKAVTAADTWKGNRKAPETGKTISINDKEEKRARKAVVDVLGEKFPWRTAIQAGPVKNVISAISLNDRVLFINTLFKEDPMAFQEAIAAFNSMTSMEEAEKYVFEKHPDWNFSSDTVFKLMMAVKRKLD